MALVTSRVGMGPPAVGYRAPTDSETRRVRDCFDAFDSAPGGVVVCSFGDSESTTTPAVFTTRTFGQRLTYVDEELLEVITDDELAVAFAQSTPQRPLPESSTSIPAPVPLASRTSGHRTGRGPSTRRPPVGPRYTLSSRLVPPSDGRASLQSGLVLPGLSRRRLRQPAPRARASS